jgi:hypothetical protein
LGSWRCASSAGRQPPRPHRTRASPTRRERPHPASTSRDSAKESDRAPWWVSTQRWPLLSLSRPPRRWSTPSHCSRPLGTRAFDAETFTSAARAIGCCCLPWRGRLLCEGRSRWSESTPMRADRGMIGTKPSVRVGQDAAGARLSIHQRARTHPIAGGERTPAGDASDTVARRDKRRTAACFSWRARPAHLRGASCPLPRWGGPGDPRP